MVTPIRVELMTSTLLVSRSTTELKGLVVEALVDDPKWIKHLLKNELSYLPYEETTG